MNYCMYLRKSRVDLEAEAYGEGDTLARHRKTLSELALKKGIVISPENIYEEVVSGETLAARPVMQRLLSEVEQGMWDGVFVMELERLARGDSIDQGIVTQAFRLSGTLIITPAKTYDPQNEFDEEYIEFGLFMSRREYKTITRRMQRGRIASVKEGKYVGNIPPYGYSRKKLEQEKGWTLEINPEEADVVKMIFDWYTDDTDRVGMQLIARRLNAMGIPARKGGLWTLSSIRPMLSNPVYIGKLAYNRRPQIKTSQGGQIIKTRPRAEEYLLVDGLHPPIISDETYEKAQEYIKAHSQPVPGNRILKNPIAGIVVCGKCGRNMVRRPYSKRSCEDTLMCPCPECHNVSASLVSVEREVLNALRAWLENYKLEQKGKTEKRGNAAQIKTLESAARKLNEEIRRRKKQIERIYALFEQEVYDLETFTSRLQTGKQELAETEKKYRNLQNQLAKEQRIQKQNAELVPKVEHVLAAYQALGNAKAKNQALKSVIDRIEYYKDRGGRWGDPDDFELVLYPKLDFK